MENMNGCTFKNQSQRLPRVFLDQVTSMILEHLNLLKSNTKITFVFTHTTYLKYLPSNMTKKVSRIKSTLQLQIMLDIIHIGHHKVKCSLVHINF